MKLELLFSTGIEITIICTLLDIKKIVDLFVCFALECKRTSALLTVFPTVLRCASTVTRKFCPYVISRKIKEKCH